MQRKRVLILGLTGMLGHTLFRHLVNRDNIDIAASARNKEALSRWFAPDHIKKVYSLDADNFDTILCVLKEFMPDVVLNCIGIIKQLPIAKDPIVSISINALFPHRLAEACKTVRARLIHFSTDCIFSGKKGNYTENDPSDADDLYGRTKYLGEVSYPHCLTLRTSIIGHELKGGHGLIDWFLAQQGTVQGFTKAIYSGFPTVEMARIIADYVIPNTNLTGLYHVSSEPISKYDLLRLVAARYGKQIEVLPNDEFRCDRSLDSGRFRAASGYQPPAWPELVAAMHSDAIARKNTDKESAQ